MLLKAIFQGAVWGSFELIFIWGYFIGTYYFVSAKALVFQPLRQSHFGLCMMMLEWSVLYCGQHNPLGNNTSGEQSILVLNTNLEEKTLTGMTVLCSRADLELMQCTLRYINGSTMCYACIAVIFVLVSIILPII